MSNDIRLMKKLRECVEKLKDDEVLCKTASYSSRAKIEAFDDVLGLIEILACHGK